MTVLIKNATVINEKSPWNNKRVDVLIKRGQIEKIGNSIKDEQAKEIIEGENLYISSSWVDIGCRVNEPGYEQRETSEELINAAKKGGYGTIAPFPNTYPVIDNKSSIDYLKRLGKKKNLSILPIGAASKAAEGVDLAELIDMNESGCRVFSDGIKGIQNSGLLLRALQYIKSFNGIIINVPIKQSLTNNGHLHEGITSTLNGTSGIPSMAEFTAVNEQLAIAEYAESNICFYGISTKEGVKAIKSFKPKSVEVKSIVPYLNLIFTDEDLASFDTNLKVLPPLREKDDQKELIKGLTEGVITAISSNHAPFDAESKDLEFHYAKFGASGIETVFAALNTFCKKLPIDILIKALTEGPRSILELENPIIQEGDKANLTIFDLDKEWVFDQTESSSLNNPFLGKTLIGKVIKTINS